MKTFFLNALAISALAFGASSANAAVLTYGTFTGDPDSTDTLASIGVSGSIAVGFTATRSDLTISSVSFDLSAATGRGARLTIRNTLGGAAIFTSSVITPGTSAAVVTFSSINLGLTSGTTYWLVLDGTGGSGNLIVHSATGTETINPVPGMSTISGYQTSGLDSGGSPTLVDNGQLPNFNVVVPEPHEYAMVAGLGLCAFAAYRRRSARVIA